MSDLYWLTDEQMARLELLFPQEYPRTRKQSAGLFSRRMVKPGVDGRRTLSWIIFVNRKACAGKTPRQPMGRTRHSTVAGSDGARQAPLHTA